MKKIFPILIGCSLSFYSLAEKITVERYIISFPDGYHVSYKGKFASAFPDGLPVGVGSGLLFSGKGKNDLSFVTVTDRGPNANSPNVDENEAKIFLTPDFIPHLMTIRVQNGKAEAVGARLLHDENGDINGLPLQNGVIGSTNEVALSDTLKTLSSDNRGLDTEGITHDGKGGYWLCDEYGPFLINTDHKGKIISIYGPQPDKGEKAISGGLPNILKWRQPNRGFEGITRMPDGRIIAAVQSTLDINGKSKNKAVFTRLVVFNPATGETEMYGYPIDRENYNKNSDAKIGDIVALDNKRILLIEQGEDKSGKMRNLIYTVDLSNASELTVFDNTGEYPEFDDQKELTNRGIILADKTKIIDLRELGWQHEKAEGLALIDNKSFAVINDNDFGVKTDMQNSLEGKTLKDYRVNSQGGLILDGKAVATMLNVKPLNRPESDSEMWIVKLSKEL